ncbi:hypothetical protein Bbelb_016030 [Branchiostoma belcheri]|nr:hypothetical protein Bbelb_016030 [Branchiostoma belcheri]
MHDWEKVGSKVGCGWLVFGEVGYCIAAPAECFKMFQTFGSGRGGLAMVVDWLAGGCESEGAFEGSSGCVAVPHREVFDVKMSSLSRNHAARLNLTGALKSELR